jgi:hypothetical protein
MTRRRVIFYLGVWLPMAISWVVVVLIAAAVMKDVAIWIGLGAAVGGPLLAILLGAQFSEEDKKGSVGFIVSPPELTKSDIFKVGLRKGLILGPVSVVFVALLPVLIFAVDRILTALGK